MWHSCTKVYSKTSMTMSGHIDVYNLYNESNMQIRFLKTIVLVENRPLVKFIRNFIRDSSGVFPISSLVRISMKSFPTLTLLFVQKCSSLYNKKEITRWLEDMNFIFSWKETIFYSLAALARKILFLPLENKIHTFVPLRNILYI